tara:strand:- start:36 stop:185 length:150 start_codon:yes stop_codon:yes gene_type:complete
MSDIIIKTIEEARKKGKLKRTDLMLRYLKMKHNLVMTLSALEKRIKLFT